jgi:hypothetical protein
VFYLPADPNGKEIIPEFRPDEREFGLIAEPMSKSTILRGF